MSEKVSPLWHQILKLATPLILSMTGLMLMQFVDALFLSWYSADAIAAVGPASMASYLLISIFQGTAGFTSTLVAHYEGAGRSHRSFAATWQGIYISILAAVVLVFLGFLSEPLFKWVNHAPQIQQYESSYFAIILWGGFASVASAALSGFFSGRGKTATLMAVQLVGFGINAILDYALIFGRWGFPQWGMEGAAIATVAAQVIVLLVLFYLFLGSEVPGAHPWRDRVFEATLFKRLLRFGIPNGLRFGFEMLAWTVFVFFVGRIGNIELAATNIAFRINGIAFFPIVGLGQAVGILVGQAQGRRDPDRAVRLTYTGFFMAELWMILVALSFLLIPSQLYGLFRGDEIQQYDLIVSTGVTLLRFVAVYSVFDAGNIIFVSSLQCAGDTRWTMMFSILAHSAFLAVLALADTFKLGIWFEWTAATFFVTIAAITWWLRFRSGKWKQIRLIETQVQETYD